MCDGSSSDIVASWPYCDPLYTLTACCEAYVGDGMNDKRFPVGWCTYLTYRLEFRQWKGLAMLCGMSALARLCLLGLFLIRFYLRVMCLCL